MSFNPTELLHASIANFIRSPEIALLEHLLSNPAWYDQTDAATLLDIVCTKASALSAFTTKLVRVATDLAQKQLTAEFVYNSMEPCFNQNVSTVIGNCVKSAYGRKPQAADIDPAYFAVLIHSEKQYNSVIASALVNFQPFPDNSFKTNMEAVQKNWQRKGVAADLFKFTELAVEHLMEADGFVRISMGNGHADTLESLKDHPAWKAVMTNLSIPASLMLESCVDHDAPAWHGSMMEKMGFECEGRVGDDVVFSKEIRRI